MTTFNSPTFVDAAQDASVHGTTTRTCSVSVPSNIKANEFILIIQPYASYDSTNDTYTDPAGFQELTNNHVASNSGKIRILGYIANGTETGTWTFTFPTITTGTKGGLIMLRWDNVSAVAIDNGHGAGGSGAVENYGTALTSPASTNHTMPTFTIGAGDDNTQLIEVMFDRGSGPSTAFTWPAGQGWTVPTNGSIFQTTGGSIAVAVAYKSSLVNGNASVGGETVTGTISTANAIQVLIALRPSIATTTVSKSPTFLYNTQAQITKARTFLYNVAAGTTTNVSKNITLLHSVSMFVSATPTFLYNTGAKIVEFINEFANVYDSQQSVQIFETIQDAANATDQETTAANTLRVIKQTTFLHNVLSIVQQNVEFDFNIITAGSVTKVVTLLFVTHRAKTTWVAQPEPTATTWTEVE